MAEGTKIKIGTKIRLLLPSGDIHAMSKKTSEPLRKIYNYEDGNWYTSGGREVQFEGNDKALLLKKLKALQKKSPSKPTRKTSKKPTKSPKKLTRVPKVPKTSKEPKTQVPKPKGPKSRIEELKGVTKMKLGDQYLCTYKSLTFFIRKSPESRGKGWVIVEELKDGSQSGLPGVFKTPDSAILYYKKVSDVAADEVERIRKSKGGKVLDKIKWKEGDRIVYDNLGAFRIGTIRQALIDPWTKMPYLLYVQLDGEKETLDIETKDPAILGRGVPKENTEPIPPGDIDKWIKKEKEEKKKYSFVMDERVNLPIAIEDYWDNFTKKVFTYIKREPFKKMVHEYMLDYPLIIIEPDPLSGKAGSYWGATNAVKINWKHIVKVDEDAAVTLVHEVIHYKTWPIKSKVKNWLKKNIYDVLNLNKHNPKIKTWEKKFFKDPTLKNIPWSTKRLRKLLEDYGGEPHDYLYALTNYLEAQSSLHSLVAVGKKIINPLLAKLEAMLLTEFEAQLKK